MANCILNYFLKLFRVVFRLPTECEESMADIIRDNILPEDQDDVKKQLDSMKNLLPDSLTSNLFKTHLERYSNYIRPVYQTSEDMCWESIPESLQERVNNEHGPFFTRDKLSHMDYWIQYFLPIT